jgi:hypothetical protein
VERNSFVHAGLSIGAEQAAVGLQLARGMLVTLAGFAALGHYVAAGRSPARSRRVLLLLGLTLTSTLVCAGLALLYEPNYLGALGVWPLPIAVLLSGVSGALVSIRDPQEPVEQARAGRGRALVVVSAVLAVLALWSGMAIDAWAEFHVRWQMADGSKWRCPAPDRPRETPRPEPSWLPCRRSCPLGSSRRRSGLWSGSQGPGWRWTFSWSGGRSPPSRPRSRWCGALMPGS